MNPYKILGVRKNATPDQITAAYRRRSKQTHPDRGGDAEEFKQVKDAYDVLMDPEARKLYDETGEIHSKFKTTTPSPVQDLIRGAFQGALQVLVNQAIDMDLPFNGWKAHSQFRRDIDFLAITKNKIAESRNGIRQDKNKLESAKKKLEEILGKFSYPDEECFLNLFIQKEIIEMDFGIQSRIKEIEEHDAALAYLNNCSFQEPQRPTGTVKELRDRQRELLGVTGDDDDITS